MRRPVTIARYLDLTEAQLARVRLGGEGIESFVIEAAGFNPLLSGAAGGVQLQVRERDIERARAILAEPAAEPEAEDDAADDPGEPVVRCPRCELEYCFHERARVVRNAPMPILVIANLFVAGASKLRWRCRKCEHVWDDPAAGPARMTRLLPGDPKPVFRLRRGQAGMGLFLGLMVGFFGTVVIGSGAFGREVAQGVFPASVLVMSGLLGWLIGRSARRDVCSEPSCRAPLPGGADECPSCKGAISGAVTSAPEHFAAAGEARREIAASREVEAPRKKKKKKPVAPAAPAP
jgi:hypothetical protein